MFTTSEPYLEPGLHLLDLTWLVSDADREALSKLPAAGLADLFRPDLSRCSGQDIGLDILGVHCDTGVTPWHGREAGGQLSAKLWLMVSDAEKLNSFMNLQSVTDNGRSADQGMRHIARASNMPVAEHFDKMWLQSASITHDENPIMVLPEGDFSVRLEMTVDVDYWHDEVGEAFSLESFKTHMMQPAFAHPEQLGIHLDRTDLTRVKPGSWVLDVYGHITDGVAVAAATATLMRDNGYDDDVVPADPGVALTEIWLLSNVAPSPDLMGITYGDQHFTAGASSTPAKEIRQPSRAAASEGLSPIG